MVRTKELPSPKAQDHESWYDGEKLQGVLSGWRVHLWRQGVHATRCKVREGSRHVCAMLNIKTSTLSKR